jgi:hypothetical protein
VRPPLLVVGFGGALGVGLALYYAPGLPVYLAIVIGVFTGRIASWWVRR